MSTFPHSYRLSAILAEGGLVRMTTDEGALLECAAPANFGGEPGGQSPESLLTEAVASCFMLSFVAIARASGFEWNALSCEVEGILDKADRALKFTAFNVVAELEVRDAEACRRGEMLLQKAENTCLVSNSLACPVNIRTKVVAGD